MKTLYTVLRHGILNNIWDEIVHNTLDRIYATVASICLFDNRTKLIVTAGYMNLTC